LNILLVDDDYLLAKGTARLIERLGHHKVIITDDPTEIFSLCRTGTIDIVLMDVNLPGALWEKEDKEDKSVSGVDLSRFLRNDPITAHIPVILVTAYAMLAERQTLLSSSQADELCTKPITDYEGFLKLIDTLYHKSQQQKDSRGKEPHK
jgi:two-component system cell cycle response regulator DivK